MIRQPFKARTPEELIALLSAVATAILTVIIIMLLYFGREIIIPDSVGNSAQLRAGASRWAPPTHPHPARVGCRERRHNRLRTHICDGKSARHPTDATGGGFAAISIDDKREDPIISRNHRRSGHAGTRVRHVEGPQQRTGQAQGGCDSVGSGRKPEGDAPPKPVPVEVRQPDPGALESLQSLISPLLHPLATTGIIVIFVIFILLQREDLRNRLIRLAGSHDLQRTTAALDDAASRLSRLFLIQLLLNGSFGIIIGSGLWPTDPGALESLQSLISPLLHPLATTGIIVIFVIFILLQREDLRNRLIRLAGSHDLQRTTAALDDAASRLSRLFLIQLLLNGSFGIIIGTGLWLIGVPSAILWGILAAVLRFVPYIGAAIAAAFPLALAVAVDPTWSMLLWTLALFVVVEPIVGHVIEPMVYGHSTGLSPVAVVASATFWTALWGPIGLVLATPLTVCLVVLGRHVESLVLRRDVRGSAGRSPWRDTKTRPIGLPKRRPSLTRLPRPGRPPVLCP